MNEHHTRQWSLLEVIRSGLRKNPLANRLIKGIALILLVAVAISLLVSATLALVGLK